MKKGGYILSLVAGTISSSYVLLDDQLGVPGVIGGLIMIIFVSAIPPAIIYIFYRKNFQNIFTICCVTLSTLLLLQEYYLRTL
ncbi:hypothetical protein N9T03_01635 [Bacteroidota bacterium]|nr:hypothetical protein [Bacteroidota bacterium]